MRPSRSASFIAAICAITQCSAAEPSISDLQPLLNVVSNRFMIELNQLSDVMGKRSNFSHHNHLYSTLRSRGVGFQIDKEFDEQQVFVGVALTLDDAQDIEKLQSVPGIASIRPVLRYSRPELVWSQSSEEFTASSAPVGPSTHIMTGVDKVHRKGNSGEGVKIGMIDTGIDYTHPALGGKFGPGHKVRGGYDFVGDDYTGDNTPKPDNDPLDQCDGHGTHVAGIIVADPGTPHGIVGVAYSATLSVYRIFGCYGYTTDDIIVDAMVRALHDGQDIITLSIGEDQGWSHSTTSVVASRIAALGKIVTIAAGNSGVSGAFYTSSPAAGVDVISVASVDNSVLPLQNATVVGGKRNPITYYADRPLKILTPIPIFATSRNMCRRLQEGTFPDLSSVIAVVQRSTECDLVDQFMNLGSDGAQYVLFFDEGQGMTRINNFRWEAALISNDDGKWLVQQYEAKKPIKLSFPQTGAGFNYPNPTGNLISYFSSYGPSNDFYFKPAVAAPGGFVMSLWPTALGSYKVASGTSMATPFVAGVSALYLNAKGKSRKVVQGTRTALEATAKKVYSSQDQKLPLQTVCQQGAGMVSAYDLIYSTTTISRGELILNDTTNFEDSQTFTVTNTGSSTQQYTVKHVAAGTAKTVKPNSIISAPGPLALTQDSLTVRLSTTSFTLRPGRSEDITARFSVPKSNKPSDFSLYSGFIEVASTQDRVHATYIALGGSLKQRPVLDVTSSYFGSPMPSIRTSEDAQRGPHNYTFRNWDVPSLVYSLAFASPSVRVDLVPGNFRLASKRDLESDNQGDRDYGKKKPHFTFPRPQPGGSFEKVKTIGPLVAYEDVGRSLPFNHDQVGYSAFTLETPTFANGTIIPPGPYRFLLRALRVSGNPKKQEDYDTWVSPEVIGIYPI